MPVPARTGPGPERDQGTGGHGRDANRLSPYRTRDLAPAVSAVLAGEPARPHTERQARFPASVHRRGSAKLGTGTGAGPVRPGRWTDAKNRGRTPRRGVLPAGLYAARFAFRCGGVPVDRLLLTGGFNGFNDEQPVPVGHAQGLLQPSLGAY